MTVIHPLQIWDRKEPPFCTVLVCEIVSDKVMYRAAAPSKNQGDVITISKATFKQLYRKRSRRA